MTERNIHPEDQVGLTGLKLIVLDLTRIFFRACSFLSYIIRRNKFLITLGLAAGLLAGYVYYSIKPQHYEVSMIVEFNDLTKKTYAEMIDQLNNLVASGSGQRLATELNLPQNIAGKVVYLESRNMSDEPLSKDTSTKIMQQFVIIAGLHDNLAFSADSLQTGILNYLNSSPYLKKVKEEEKIIYTAKLAAIESDLSKLDTLKTEFNRFLALSKVSSTIYNNAVNPADFYVQSSLLLTQRETTLRELTINGKAVSLVDGFKISRTPKSISLSKSITLLGSAGVLLAFLLAFFNETRKKIMPAPAPLTLQK